MCSEDVQRTRTGRVLNVIGQTIEELGEDRSHFCRPGMSNVETRLQDAG